MDTEVASVFHIFRALVLLRGSVASLRSRRVERALPPHSTMDVRHCKADVKEHDE
jgi:hypothetical protein